MKKVTIEITPKGYDINVELDGKKMTERHIADNTGSICVEGDFEEELDISEELYDALSGFTFFEIMRALQ